MEETHELPFYYEIPIELNIEYMIFQMSGEDPTKYNYIMRNYDIDDYILWIAFKIRDNKASEWRRKNNN